MSATRDPDRIFRAWLAQMPDEAPDRAIAAVLQATAAAPQVRAWPRVGPWRPKMNRLSLIAATAVVAHALVGGTMLLVGNQSNLPTATASPTAVPTPTAAPIVGGTFEEELRSTWVANAPAGSAGGVLRLELGPELLTVTEAGSITVLARHVTGESTLLSFVATNSSYGCLAGEVGRYGFLFGRPSGDAAAGDMQLSLTATTDACAGRQAILERTWTRSFTSGFVGGRAVAIDFDPMFLVTLPAGAYSVTVSGRDALMVEGLKDGDAPGAFVATRNPAGYSDPCSETGGSKVRIAHTVDAFATYLASLPGFTVQRSEVEIGGLPAVHLTVPTKVTADCPRADHRVLEWSTSDPTFSVKWQLGQGDVTDSIYLVEVGSDLYLFQWLRPTIDEQVEMSVLSTIEFIDSIPG